jgi:hypothetical protein
MIAFGPVDAGQPGETWVPRQDQVPLLARFAADYPEPGQEGQYPLSKSAK